MWKRPTRLTSLRGECWNSTTRKISRRCRGCAIFLLIAIRRWQSACSSCWTHSAATTSPDLVVLDENQLQQVSVEPAGMRTITLDRNATGKVGFNEDRLTPVFTPYAGRVLGLLANKGASVSKGQPLVVLESPELVA